MLDDLSRFTYLRTKLNPPRLTEDILVRERLLKRLGYQDALTLVVAPAGYGKTTLAATWLGRAPWPGAWLTLDSTDNSLALFLTGLVAALREVFPECGREVLELVGAPVELTPELVLPPLLDALHRVGRPFALVLDDYHTITSRDVHQVLTGVVAYPPAVLHLLLCTRHDPPLPPRIRLSGMVNEVRMQELSFTEAETAEFLERAVMRPLDSQSGPALTQQVEGWPAALRLVAIMARQGRDISQVDEAVRASGNQLMGYLTGEVLNRLPDEVQMFVERTAILRRLCGPLCATVVGVESEQAANTLRGLEQAGLFLVNIDEVGDWYRYHALFRTLMWERLARQVATTQIEELHRCAANWYEAHEMLDDALHHLIALTDKGEAVLLVARQRSKLLLQNDFRRIEQWVALFPTAVVQDSPDLLLCQGWLSQFYNEVVGVDPYCRRIEEIAARSTAQERARQWRGEAKSLMATRYFLSSDARDAMAAGREALNLLTEASLYAHSNAGLALSVALQADGRQAEAYAFLDSLRQGSGFPYDLVQLRYYHLASYIHYGAGDLPALRTAGEQSVALAAPRGMTSIEGWGHHFWGCACYLQNDLAGAYEQFGILVERRYQFPAMAAVQGTLGLALTFQALNLPVQASAMLEHAQQYFRSLRGRHLFNLAQALAAELAARQGRPEEAMRWLRQGPTLALDNFFFLYSMRLAVPKVLLAEDTAHSRSEAGRVLAELRRQTSEHHNVRFQIEVLVLQAVLYSREGDSAAAQAALAEALRVAAPGGHLRPFVDYAADLGPMLDAWQPPAGLEAFTVQVRRAIEFAQEPAGGPAWQPAEAPAQPLNGHRGLPAETTLFPASTMAAGNGRVDNLLELLTFREMDVLLLLGRRLTNKEIARDLGISVDTVKQHTVNLYRKLGVENRRQAIIYAAEVEAAAIAGSRRE